MTEQHPITPPPELVKQWSKNGAIDESVVDNWVGIATQAARWSADQELEACCEWLEKGPYGFSIAASAPDLADDLRAARRPKPPTLKEQALKLIDSNSPYLEDAAINTIRRALEQLDD